MGVSVLSTLGVKSVDFMAPGRGGVPSLTRSDVAAAMAGGLSEPAQCLAYFLFTGEVRAELALAHHIRSAIIANNPDMDSRIADGLTRSVMAESFDHSRCRACRGSGQIVSKVPLNTSDTHGAGVFLSERRELMTCDRCDGHGVSQWTAFKRAKMAGMNERSFTRLYSAARAAGARSVRAWMGELTSHLTQRLQGQDD